MRIAYVLSNVKYSVAFEWIVDRMEQSSISFVFIFLDDKKPRLQNRLEARGIKCEFIYFKNSFFNYLTTIFHIYKILHREKVEVIHTHLFHASLLGLIAAKIAALPKRIHTRHHSTFHHDYHPHAVKYDRLVNLLSTDVVAISRNVKSILIDKEKVNSKKIKIIEHGFDLSEFSNVSRERVDVIFNKYKLPKQKKIIGSIARYVNWKGHIYLIEAYKELLKSNPDIHLVLANANGPYRSKIKSLLSQLPSNSFTEITFEEDLFALYQAFDVFVHIPINSQVEAFGQTYVEALAAGVPSVFTLSGIAPDFIKDKVNSIVVDYRNSEEVRLAILSILKNDNLKFNLINNGKESISRFTIEYMIKNLSNLYQNGIYKD